MQGPRSAVWGQKRAGASLRPKSMTWDVTELERSQMALRLSGRGPRTADRGPDSKRFVDRGPTAPPELVDTPTALRPLPALESPHDPASL